MGPFIPYTRPTPTAPTEFMVNRRINDHIPRWNGIQVTCLSCNWHSSNHCSTCSTTDWQRHVRQPMDRWNQLDHHRWTSATVGFIRCTCRWVSDERYPAGLREWQVHYLDELERY